MIFFKRNRPKYEKPTKRGGNSALRKAGSLNLLSPYIYIQGLSGLYNSIISQRVKQGLRTLGDFTARKIITNSCLHSVFKQAPCYYHYYSVSLSSALDFRPIRTHLKTYQRWKTVMRNVPQFHLLRGIFHVVMTEF